MNSGNHLGGGSVSAEETSLVDPPMISSVVAEASALSQASESLLDEVVVAHPVVAAEDSASSWASSETSRGAYGCGFLRSV